MEEFADVLAWVATLANQTGVDLTAAAWPARLPEVLGAALRLTRRAQEVSRRRMSSSAIWIAR